MNQALTRRRVRSPMNPFRVSTVRIWSPLAEPLLDGTGGQRYPDYRRPRREGRLLSPRCWDYIAMTEEMYGEAGLWEGLEENVVNVGNEPSGQRTRRGRAEAFIVYTSNYSQLPSWATEIDSRVSVRAIEMTDDYVQASQDFAGAGYEEVDEIGGGWGRTFRAVTSREAHVDGDLPYYFSPDISADAVYDLMEIYPQ